MGRDKDIEVICGTPCKNVAHGNWLPLPCIRCEHRDRSMCRHFDDYCRFVFPSCGRGDRELLERLVKLAEKRNLGEISEDELNRAAADLI